MSADENPRELLRRIDEVDFRDLIYGMAESVSEAQVELDRNLAATMVEFAETEVDVVPQVTRTIAEDGTVTYDSTKRAKRSLLDLGLTPTRYQFSEATVDVAFDLSFAVGGTDTADETGRSRLRADTREAHHQRRYYGEIDTTAKISARLVPVPTPATLTPATVEPTAESATDADADAETDVDADVDTDADADTETGATAEPDETDDESNDGHRYSTR
ncbi:hypothetical protein [Salinigranum halophilum]|jgi:hypothetical protein|uniref:hypothetical protein n=1 Tax=Salinigranum halophilum TaxID=2565931 RepID=UPI00115F21DE|nr:hypothetical protein [Salinigranum halophilum]